MSSAPTLTSLASDRTMDRAMGHGTASSGGRGVSKYTQQMTRRQREAHEKGQKAAKETERLAATTAKTKVSELKRAMEAGELDWM